MTYNIDFGFGTISREDVFENSYKEFKDGDYDVSGVDSWITKDDNETPYFTLDKLNRRIVRGRLRQANGEQGPPFSASAAELAALVYVICGPKTAKQLPQDEGPAFLDAVMHEINEMETTWTVKVNKSGWVSNLGGDIPPGKYQIKPIYAYNREGSNKYYPVRNDFGGGRSRTFMTIVFEIVGNEAGLPTRYNGYQIHRNMDEAFDPDTKPNEEGDIGPAPLMVEREDKKTGEISEKITPAILNWQSLLVHFAPTLSDGTEWIAYKWSVRDAQSPYELYVTEMIKQGRVAVAMVDKFRNAKSVNFHPNKLEPVEQAVVDMVEQVQAEEAQAAGVYDVIVKIEEYAKDPDIGSVVAGSVFEDTPQDSNEVLLTDEGKVWCKDNIVPIWTKLDLPVNELGQRQFGILTDEQCQSLLKAMAETFNMAKNVSF